MTLELSSAAVGPDIIFRTKLNHFCRMFNN